MASKKFIQWARALSGSDVLLITSNRVGFSFSNSAFDFCGIKRKSLLEEKSFIFSKLSSKIKSYSIINTRNIKIFFGATY